MKCGRIETAIMAVACVVSVLATADIIAGASLSHDNSGPYDFCRSDLERIFCPKLFFPAPVADVEFPAGDARILKRTSTLVCDWHERRSYSGWFFIKRTSKLTCWISN